MYRSIFWYNIQGPHPFVWFTPLVFTGGIIAAILFSLLNFILTGYTLNVQYSQDPNTTISAEKLFRNLPSALTSKISPSCQPVELPVYSSFFTNQSALKYTLPSVGEHGSDSGAASSLTYLNNVLQDCSISSVQISMSAFDRTAAQVAWRKWGVVLREYVRYIVLADAGQTPINLTTTYDCVHSDAAFPNSDKDATGLASFIVRDSTTRASLYWGESLLNMFQGYLSKTLENIRRDASSSNATDRFGPQDKGAIYFTVNGTFADNVESLDYFTIDYHFFREYARGNVITNYPRNSSLDLISVASLGAAAIYPNVWIPADKLAKSFRSVILTDLGQLDEKKTGLNILTNDSLLEHFTANFSIAAGVQANTPPGPAREQYSLLRTTAGALQYFRRDVTMRIRRRLSRIVKFEPRALILRRGPEFNVKDLNLIFRDVISCYLLVVVR